MSREWLPGDVAVDKYDGKRAFLVNGYSSLGCPDHHPTGPHWHYQDSDWNPAIADSMRPLVVIDPESDADIATVENALETLGCRVGTKVQAALRSLITPPRPEEPTGLGAVAEDADGRKWIRVEWQNPWCLAKPTEREPHQRIAGMSDVAHGSHHTWDRINAVRVLSEGVTQ